MDQANEHIQIFHHARHIPPLPTVTPSALHYPTPYIPTGIWSPRQSLPLIYQFGRQAGGGRGDGGMLMGLLHSSLRLPCFQKKNPAPRRPQTRREEGMEKIPCIPRLCGLQTSWRVYGEARPLGPIPKLPFLPSCLASVCLSLLMCSCLFKLQRRHPCEHTLPVYTLAPLHPPTRSFPQLMHTSEFLLPFLP